MIPKIIEGLPESILLHGERGEGETWVTIDGEYLNLNLSLKIYNHSPTGFNWGYGGSGPAQLSLAILLEFLPVKLAEKYKSEFKRKVISVIKEDVFTVAIPFRQIIYEIARIYM